MKGAAALLAIGLLSPTQERGKAIYLSGESKGGRAITALLGSDAAGIPAAIVPCVNCHGEDGRGKPEGGVRPADITPEALGQGATFNGRKRPPYTRPLLKRAITMGFDSGRHPLNEAMPHYRMSMEDAEDLLSYLEILGHEPQPGVTDDAIRIRVTGDTGPLPSATIYGRKLEVVREGVAFLAIDASADPSASLAAAEREGIPTIVVQSPTPVTNRWAFCLTASEEDQRAALRKYAADAVVLTAAEARLRDLASLPADKRVIVAAPLPPTPEATRNAAATAMAIVTKLLAQLGRDVTRGALAEALQHVYRVDALQHVYGVDTKLLPTITWDANRHHGTRSAWLMTLDRQSQRLIAEPGWVEGEPTR
jgi:hypothetical protein